MPDAEAAPVCDGEPSIAETHVGMVVLVGDRAYKSKKPVRTAFLDFSTAERRTAALRRELQLNRRISPDVYLGLGRFSGPSHGRLGGHNIMARRLLRLAMSRREAEYRAAWSRSGLRRGAALLRASMGIRRTVRAHLS